MKKVKVLFVCLGNICRSPAAEGVMNALIEKEGLSEKVDTDSAGTAGYHNGERADARMRSAAKKRGYNLTSISRKVRPLQDFQKFDYIVAMDDDNYNDLLSMDKEGRFAAKISKVTDYGKGSASAVPDPYEAVDKLTYL